MLKQMLKHTLTNVALILGCQVAAPLMAFDLPKLRRLTVTRVIRQPRGCTNYFEGTLQQPGVPVERVIIQGSARGKRGLRTGVDQVRGTSVSFS
jgi:hypothetical protein